MAGIFIAHGYYVLELKLNTFVGSLQQLIPRCLQGFVLRIGYVEAKGVKFHFQSNADPSVQR